MAMGTGAKIAVGCGCLLVLGAAAALGVVGLGAWWAKDKLTEAAGGLDTIVAKAGEIERYEKLANAHPYAPPADGVIPEERFLAFLETRRRVHEVYERYEPDLRELRRAAETANDKLSPSDLWSAGGTLAQLVGEIRLAQMKALAELGMSEEEYRAIQFAVYKTAWASDVETDTGRTPSEAVSGSLAEAASGMEDAVRAALEAARREQVPGAGRVSEEDVKAAQDEMARLGREAGQVLEVPRANVELFRKHEAEIKKYAMNGLAYVGL